MIHCILTYSKGFICSGGSGTLHMFEKTDNKDVYKKVRPVTILEETSGSAEQADGGISSPPLDNNIMSMDISPSEEIVICSTVSQQLYSLALSTADMGKVIINNTQIHTLYHFCDNHSLIHVLFAGYCCLHLFRQAICNY